MEVTFSMISLNTGGKRENKRRDLVINCCKTLDTDFSILQETNVNFSHLHNIREIWDGEAIILSEKTQTCGVLILAKRITSPIEQIITDPAGKICFFQNRKYNRCCLSLICPFWNNEGAAHGPTDVCMKN